jgi:tRNA-modifying protein YgfZ
MSLAEYHRSLGAQLAPDNIPLHYGNQLKEYDHAINSAVLLDRSHEGRIIVTGKTRFELINRMSTNNLVTLKQGQGCATIFTTTNARILERIEAFHQGDNLLVLTQPPRRESMFDLLKRNIFFNDEAQLNDITSETHQFSLHGIHANAIIKAIYPNAKEWELYQSQDIEIGSIPFTLAKRKPVSGEHWMFITSAQHTVALHQYLLRIGQEFSLIPAGSLTFNAIRIRAGFPSINELNDEYLPLELGLWDEVSFHKGCYTGQEVIARMDSREKLARVMVSIQPDKFVGHNTPIQASGVTIGTLTSSVQAPNGDLFAIGVIKATYTHPDTYITIGDIPAKIISILGTQPIWVTEKGKS